jgi:hypothetical protein
MAGPPDGVDISTTTRHVEIAAPNSIIHTRWQAIIGAVAQPARPDVLGAMIIATTPYRHLWSVTVRTHISHGAVGQQ